MDKGGINGVIRGLIANRSSSTDTNNRDAATLAAATTPQGVGEGVSQYGPMYQPQLAMRQERNG